MRLCCRQHDRNRLLQRTQTMFHVFFRSIFGIPSLILVLLPATSSDCEIKDKNNTIEEYMNVLFVNIQHLEKMTDTASNCSNKEYSSLKNHTCDDNKEVMFIVHVTCKLKQLVKANISENFNGYLEAYSHHALEMLKGCKCDEEKEKKAERKIGRIHFTSEVSPTKNTVSGTEKKTGGPCFKILGEKSSKERKKQNKCLCLIQKMISDVSNCWRKILNMNANGH
ncbi:interleukin-7 isoform X1 [Phascolarctos cinereus]|uniref:Interleukin-7 n=2 Tax=Phascolarctos cinereus TaxID=38626 RepID=A0A6P5JEQ4_PHACI|nr:interleukin-7 isoform X1 [Phascolarctos cinereus]